MWFYQKKCRSENSKQESYKLRNRFLSKSKKVVDSVKKSLSCTPLEPDHIFRSNSDGGSSLFSSNSSSSRAPSVSSSASSCSSHSRSGSADKIRRSISMDFKQIKTTKKDCGRKSSCSNYNLTIEIFIVWACLFALVWGKVFAIVICTSSWLFFAPAHRRRLSHRPPPPPRKFDSFDEIDPEYRKRVIMEGLLDRNRWRGLFKFPPI